MIVCSNPDKNFFVLIVASVITVSLLLMPFPAAGLWWSEAFNSGHVILFLFISFVLYFWLSAAFCFSSHVIIYLVVLVTSFLFGLVIEALQVLMQREASVEDLYRNFCGVISGLGLVSLTRQKILRNKILLVMFSLGFLFIGSASLFQISWHYIQRAQAFPIILDFNAGWSSSFVRFNKTEIALSSVKIDDKSQLFRIRFGAGSFPAVSVIETVPDWSSYRRLCFKVASANNENMDLFVRIHDKKHGQDHQDRFNQKLSIHPGLNEIVLSLAQIEKGPLNRELDLKNIAGLILFMSNVEKSQLLEISNIYLE